MRAIFSLVGLLVLGACSDKLVIEPDLGDGKGDVASRVEDHGALDFATPRTGAFTEDLQFHGFRLTVRAGAVVTIDNTHLGTAAKLDSTLFVYGPRTPQGFGTSAIAFDDDSGWGAHARISKLRLDAGGEYLVVLGTADGRGRGHYRLVARCDNGACVDPAPACEPRLSAGIQSCMAVQIADADLESDQTTSYAEALAICTDGEALGRIFDDVCASASPPAFCDLDFESFFTTAVPPCTIELGARGGLCGAAFDQALALATDGMLFTSESDFPYDVVRAPGQGAPTAQKVLAISGMDPTSRLETRTFDQLFAFHGRPVEPDMDDFEREYTQRHRHLRRILEGNLTTTLVVRVGEIAIRVFLVGETACGELAGVATTSIET
jgi:hypothetical protein